jgi:hypothetical protein
MRYVTSINNVRSVEWGINLYEATVFAWLYECQSWAQPKQIGQNTYYHASRRKAVEELPFVTEKVDTMYRHYRRLHELKLIEIVKHENKDYIRVLEKGKTWNEYTPNNQVEELGKKSESEPNSEKNPSKLGKISEHTTIIHIPIYSFEHFWDLYDKKTGKIEAQRAWEKLTDEEKKMAVEKMNNHKAGKEQKFWKDPERYIKHKRWNDEPPKQQGTTPNVDTPRPTPGRLGLVPHEQNRF